MPQDKAFIPTYGGAGTLAAWVASFEITPGLLVLEQRDTLGADRHSLEVRPRREKFRFLKRGHAELQ